MLHEGLQVSVEPNRRGATLSRLASKGISIPAHLPELDGQLDRTEEEIVTRLLCLNAVAAVSHGLNPEIAVDWVDQEDLSSFLTPDETQFLYDAIGETETFKGQVEGMFTLAWALSLYADINLWAECDDKFAWKLPNLKVKESSAGIRKSIQLRTDEEVLSIADLAYCLDWAVTDARLRGETLLPSPIPIDLKERRRALEWLIGEEAWSEVSLDT